MFCETLKETHVECTEDSNFTKNGNNEFLRGYSTTRVRIWRYPIHDHLTTWKLWEVNVITPIVYGPPASEIDLSISHEDVRRFKDIHNNSRDENNAFLTENRPSFT